MKEKAKEDREVFLKAAEKQRQDEAFEKKQFEQKK